MKNLLKAAAMAALTIGLIALGSAQTAYGYGQSIDTNTWPGKIKLVASGTDHQLTMTSNGVVRGYGGNNTYGERTIPDGLIRPRALAAGNAFSMAIKEDGTVVAWGNARYGGRSVPPMKDVVSIAVGGMHYEAITSDGVIHSWGQTVGQAPRGVNAKKVVCGRDYSVALLADGTLRSWGAFPAPSVPSGQFVEIALNPEGRHVVALRKDGVVVAWGSATYGQTIVPRIPDGRTVKSVVAGANYSGALLDNGQILVWGDTSRFGDGVPGHYAELVAGKYNLVGITPVPKVSLTVLSSSVIGGSTSKLEGYISVDPPTEDNLTVSLKSSQPEIAQVPAAFTIPKGVGGIRYRFVIDHKLTLVDVPVTISAGYVSPTATQQLSVMPNALESLTASTALIDSGTSATGTVALIGASRTALTVALSATGGLSVPATVVIDANGKVASFPITSTASAQNTNGQITATYNGVKKTLAIPVVGQPLVRSLTVPGGFGNTRVIGKVTLSTTARFDKAVHLKSAFGMVVVPATVTVPAGQTTAAFPLDYGDVPVTLTTKVTASGFNSTLNASVTVSPNLIASLTLPATVSAGAHGTAVTGTVTLKAAVSVDTVVNLASTIGGSVPATVTVHAGSKEAHFIVKITGPISKKTTNTITATRHGVAVKKVITINP